MMLNAFTMGSFPSMPMSFTGTITRRPRLGILARYSNPSTKPPLEDRFYSPTEDEVLFLQAQIGIEDKADLKRHILEVQRKAYDIYGYPCIRFMNFIRMGIAKHPAYQAALSLPTQREGAILLDIGCCFGNDLRKAVADGWPVENTIASDLRQGYWDFGHELFGSNTESFPAAFVAGDAFDARMIAPRLPYKSPPSTPRPNLKKLRSLTPVQGRVSAIHAKDLFHLFDKKRQLALAMQLASLLTPLPGSIIFGSHVGLPKMGQQIEEIDSTMFCHSPDSWRDLWEGIYGKGKVRVDATIRRIDNLDKPGIPKFQLVWSVTLL